jgi:hypothetical protein
MTGNGRGRRPRPPGVEEIVEELRDLEFEGLEAAQAYLERRTAEYNETPQAEPGGLSPRQMFDLLYGDWDGNGALRLVRGLTLDELDGAEILVNARRMLAALDASGGLKATQAGNLNRRAVAELTEALRWEPRFAEALRTHAGTLNEMDVFPLHVLRVVLGLAGLIRKWKGAFRVTARGRALVPEDRAGELYAQLFRTFFRTFSLAYVDRMGAEHREIQDTIAFSLYRLAGLADDWTRTDILAHEIVLPDVAASVPPDHYGLDRLSWMVESRVLRPLVRFGLLEHREVPRKDKYVPDREVRRTALYRGFLRFEV